MREKRSNLICIELKNKISMCFNCQCSAPDCVREYVEFPHRFCLTWQPIKPIEKPLFRQMTNTYGSIYWYMRQINGTSCFTQTKNVSHCSFWLLGLHDKQFFEMKPCNYPMNNYAITGFALGAMVASWSHPSACSTLCGRIYSCLKGWEIMFCSCHNYSPQYCKTLNFRDTKFFAN